MTLERKRIRHEFRDDLLGKTIAEDRWSTNRSSMIWESECPAGGIYTRSESVEQVSDTPRLYNRRLRVAIELYGKDALSDPFDDQLDDFAAQVEQVAHQTLARIATDAPELGINPSLSGLTEVECGFSEDGLLPLGGVRLTFDLVYGYEPPEGDPAKLDTWATAGIAWDFPPPDATTEADDVVELPQS